MEITAVNPVVQAGTSKESAATTELAGNFNNFLKLLTAQMRNQDPLAPIQATEFTSQLAQFSAVEQAINTNVKLAQLIAAQSAGQTASSVSFLGKIIEAQGSKAALENGHAEWRYTLGGNAAATVVNILDSRGQVVRSMLGATTPGTHQLAWDGQSGDGSTLPDGVYLIQVIAQDGNGNPIPVATSFTARVTGISFSGGQVMLQTAGGNVALSNVVSVHEPDPANGI